MRDAVSTLLAAGHPSARIYPLSYLWNEYEFVQGRERARIRTEAVMMNTVIANVLMGGDGLKDFLEKLEHG